jgi:hypothetical protein
MDVKVCSFPGCGEPVSVVGKPDRAPGRPARYCEDSSHNRQAAYLTRKRERSGESAAREVSDRVASMAGGRLRLVAESLGPMLVAHRAAIDEQVSAAVAALTDLEDLTGLETELAAVRAQAGQQAMNAEVAAAQALQSSEEATAAKEAAVAEAESAAAGELDALAVAEQARAEVAGLGQRMAAMTVERDQALAAAAAAEAVISQSQVEAAESAILAQAAVLARDQADERAKLAMDRAESQVQRAEQRADTAADKVSELQVLLTRAQLEFEQRPDEAPGR